MSREDEDIEYIGLSEIPTSISTAQRIILKQNKFNVEEDEDNTGQTPKLNIPKARLHAPINQILIRTDWNDVHLFCFSPWVLKLIGSKVHLKDLSKEVLPLLVESQFKGVKACLGIQNVDCDQDKMTSNGTSTGAGSGNDEQNGDLNGKLNIWEQIKSQPPFNHRSVDDTGASSYGDDEDKASEPSDYPFTVLAHTLTHEESKLVLRASSVPSYVYACREVVSQAIKISSPANVPPSSFPKGATVDTKFNSIILENSSLGEKVQIKSSTIGKNVTVGNRCRLNNVVVMDDVTIGENCILQNSVLSKGCKLGDNCNLNDCQLGPQCSLPKGTRGKGESYLKDGE
jgi:translation initiation factor eIF-2B subunit gamma